MYFGDQFLPSQTSYHGNLSLKAGKVKSNFLNGDHPGLVITPIYKTWLYSNNPSHAVALFYIDIPHNVESTTA